MSELRRVAIYRDRLLPYAQRFIAAQLGALRRHWPVFVGRQACDVSLLPQGAPVLTPASRRGALLMQTLRRMPAEMRRRLCLERPTLMHAQFGTDGVRCAPMARELALPLLVTFRGFDVTQHPASSLPYWIYSHLRPALYRQAHTVIANCAFLRDRLLDDGCPAAKLEVVYNGIDTHEIQPDAQIERGAEVLFVGRLVEKKGVDTLLRAMRLVQKSASGATLVVIGDGPEQAAVQSLARAEGVSVEFLGRQPFQVVRDWMKRARLFCLPSRTSRSGDAEGLPNVILEAQSLGLPVVSTRHAGIPEAVRDGVSGLLVPEGDASALADRMLTLLRDEALCRRIAAEARRSVEAAFDCRRHVERLESLYERTALANAARA